MQSHFSTFSEWYRGHSSPEFSTALFHGKCIGLRGEQVAFQSGVRFKMCSRKHNSLKINLAYPLLIVSMAGKLSFCVYCCLVSAAVTQLATLLFSSFTVNSSQQVEEGPQRILEQCALEFLCGGKRSDLEVCVSVRPVSLWKDLSKI